MILSENFFEVRYLRDLIVTGSNSATNDHLSSRRRRRESFQNQYSFSTWMAQLIVRFEQFAEKGLPLFWDGTFTPRLT